MLYLPLSAFFLCSTYHIFHYLSIYLLHKVSHAVFSTIRLFPMFYMPYLPLSAFHQWLYMLYLPLPIYLLPLVSCSISSTIYLSPVYVCLSVCHYVCMHTCGFMMLYLLLSIFLSPMRLFADLPLSMHTCITFQHTIYH